MYGELIIHIRYFTQSVEGRLDLLRQAIKRYKDAQNYFALKVSLKFHQINVYIHYCITMSSVLKSSINYLNYRNV